MVLVVGWGATAYVVRFVVGVTAHPSPESLDHLLKFQSPCAAVTGSIIGLIALTAEYSTNAAKDSSIPKRDRWLFFLIITVAVNLWSAFMFPMFVSDAFTLEIFAICLGPVLWGFSLLLLYRCRGERWIAWLSVAGSVFWLIPTLGMSIEYLGR